MTRSHSKNWPNIFEIGASFYHAATSQSLWRDQIAQLVDQIDQVHTIKSVLDLGCGPGMSTFVLGRKLDTSVKITGIDLSKSMIALAQRNHRRYYSNLHNINFLQLDAANLPFSDDDFDLVVGHSFLYLVNDRPQVLEEISRVLSPGGVIALMEPAKDGSLVRAAIRSIAYSRELLDRPLTTVRFATSMVTWRIAVRLKGGITPSIVSQLFSEANFTDIECRPTLGGLGLHCTARNHRDD